MKSFDEFLNTDDRPIKMVAIPAWDAQVPTRMMTGVEREYFLNLYANNGQPKPAEVHRAILSRGLCDKDGNRLEPEVLEKVMNKNSVGIEQLMNAISDQNALSEESKKKHLGTR